MKLDFNQKVSALMNAVVEVVMIQREVAASRKEKEERKKEQLLAETVGFIKAEKFVYPEDDSLLIRDYRGAGLIIPKWVRFIAMDSDGSVWGYEEQPEMSTAENGEWDGCTAFMVGWRSPNTAKKEWRNSLREVQK